MTAPDVTPAVQRAAEANYLTRAGFRDGFREMYRASSDEVLQSWADATTPILAVALDVEEMARADWEYEHRNTPAFTWERAREGHKDIYRARMSAIRAAILGGAA